jgi:hypothetical protein
MFRQPQAHPSLRLVVRLAAAAAAAGVTFALFAGVVSLADDHPMAIAGQPSPYVLAQRRAAEWRLAAASAPVTVPVVGTPTQTR